MRWGLTTSVCGEEIGPSRAAPPPRAALHKPWSRGFKTRPSPPLRPVIGPAWCSPIPRAPRAKPRPWPWVGLAERRVPTWRRSSRLAPYLSRLLPSRISRRIRPGLFAGHEFKFGMSDETALRAVGAEQADPPSPVGPGFPDLRPKAGQRTLAADDLGDWDRRLGAELAVGLFDYPGGDEGGGGGHMGVDGIDQDWAPVVGRTVIDQQRAFGSKGGSSGAWISNSTSPWPTSASGQRALQPMSGFQGGLQVARPLVKMAPFLSNCREMLLSGGGRFSRRPVQDLPFQGQGDRRRGRIGKS